ncbi:MAG: hypothetical protein CVV21_10035 [Candidatus Goldiibacteriota bacterium HGW-Goldbacteria-1]|jgi:uncharacterized protein YybS (DUF2232 family)|nr:MAG: hypothetical protein CVV21_10035 [Candidatus Goldiibacteriota bacterium HGW-Goldbacteria-1]
MAGDILFFLSSLAFIFLFFGALDFFMLGLIKRQVGWVKVIVLGTCFVFLSVLALYLVFKASTGHDMKEYMDRELNRSVEAAVEAQRKAGLPEADIQAAKKQVELFVVKTAPAWSMLSVLFMVFLNYTFTRMYALKKFGIEHKMAPFSFWWLDLKVMWLALAAMAVLAGRDLINNEAMQTAAINVLFVLGNLYFLIGLSVASFFMDKRGMPGFVKILVYMSAVFLPLMSAVLIATGALDTWFSFRKAKAINIKG